MCEWELRSGGFSGLGRHSRDGGRVAGSAGHSLHPEGDEALGTQLEGAERPRGQTQGRADLFFLKLAGGEEGKGISGQRNSRNKGSEADVSTESTSRTTAGEARPSGGEAGAEPPLPPSTGASLLLHLPPRWGSGQRQPGAGRAHGPLSPTGPWQQGGHVLMPRLCISRPSPAAAQGGWGCFCRSGPGSADSREGRLAHDLKVGGRQFGECLVAQSATGGEDPRSQPRRFLGVGGGGTQRHSASPAPPGNGTRSVFRSVGCL